MATNVIMPQLGESIVEGTVSKWLKREGDAVQEFDPIMEVNTDKVDTEIPAPASGTLLKVYVPEGTTVKAGTLLAIIGQPGETVADGGNGHAAAGALSATALSTGAPPATHTPAPGTAAAAAKRDLGFISPVVARLADEHQVDLRQVTGTGSGGRITKKDVLAYLEQRPAQPQTAGEGDLPPWEQPGEGDLFRPTELQFGAGAPAAKPPGSADVPPAGAGKSVV